jgi:uncharacterized protein YegL
MGKKSVPPLIILISDGGATDDFNSQLKKLLMDKWGKRSVRIPIAIGDDCDENLLDEFRFPKEGKLLKAKNAADLVKFIRYASVTLSSELSQGKDGNQLPAPPQTNVPQLGGDPGDATQF